MKICCTRRIGAWGFTLVEVLVALVIVALGMGALLGTLSSAADSTAYLRDKSFAQWVAFNKIAETRLKTTRPGKGKTTGEVDFAGRRWFWQQEIADTEIEGVRRIEVSVRPADVRATEENPQWVGTAGGVLGANIAPSNGRSPWFESQQPGPQGPGEDDDDDGSPDGQNPEDPGNEGSDDGGDNSGDTGGNDEPPPDEQ